MAEKRLNILFLSGWYPNRVLPTLGNFVQKHAEAVALNANVVALNVCSDAGCKQKYETTESTVNNVHAVNVYYKKVQHSIPLISQLQKLVRSAKAYSMGLKAVQQKMPVIDLVHHNILYPSGIIALYLKKFKHIPYIITEHSTIYLPEKNMQLGGLQKWISKKIVSNAACVTPVSKNLRDAMISKGLPGNYEIVYNVVDTHLFSPPVKTVPQKVKLLHISTLDDPHKNISGMLRAIAKLAAQRTDFECWFIGDGDTAPHIQTAKELGIYGTFAFFDGTKTTVEIAALMRSSNCFLMFSNYENMPVVISEALACGIPVISSNVGGIAEHITSDKGILVTAQNEKELLTAMNAMIKNIMNNVYDPQQLSSYAKANFSYEKVSEKFYHLYQRILKKDV
ncbi:MAG: glycosyltransferase family 4 protein [Bacteroidetes bacterium]|nr:glycosyltransferase family 4 protein [Bacteroidota bacterium]